MVRPEASLETKLSAFVYLSNDDRAAIGKAAARRIIKVPARCEIVREGDQPHFVHVILSGWAQRYKQLIDGRRQILAFLVPGDPCDGNVFILERMDHTVASVTEVQIAQISPAEFNDVRAVSPRIARALLWQELVTVAVQREWTTNIGQRTSYERIAHLLCELYMRLRVTGLVEDQSCDFPLTQSDLAEASGLTQVHVNRTIQELRRAGLVEVRHRRLTMIDFDRLIHVAMFNPNYLHLGRDGGRRIIDE